MEGRKQYRGEQICWREDANIRGGGVVKEGQTLNLCHKNSREVTCAAHAWIISWWRHYSTLGTHLGNQPGRAAGVKFEKACIDAETPPCRIL